MAYITDGLMSRRTVYWGQDKPIVEFMLPLESARDLNIFCQSISTNAIRGRKRMKMDDEMNGYKKIPRHIERAGF